MIKVGGYIDRKTVEGYALLNTCSERCYLTITNPDSDQSLPPPGLDAEMGQGADHSLLKQMHIVRHCEVMLSEGENRIADELAGTVIGYVAAALYTVDGDASTSELVIGRQDVRRVCVATQSDGWLMLKQEEHVANALVASCLNQCMLKLPHALIWFASQIED